MPGTSRRFAPLDPRHGPHNVHLIVDLLIGLYVRRDLRPLQRTLKMAYISHFKLNALRPNNFDVYGPMSEILVPFVLPHRELSFDTSLASGGGQKRKIPRYAPRANISIVCGPISKILVPFVLPHRELSFDTSLASGGGQERPISTNALRPHNFDFCR
ncbi:hypothetical protein DdX_19575 [Ditylenchus destructor]|uniref:Uncharacterized protein n=1 Tax=Ditylenchus destructor TaxID=166010 RepID=A0AAD4MIL0_9BILA|nr:hypothetical protein DdX_19575 [Ditylenchus destructor]